MPVLGKPAFLGDFEEPLNAAQRADRACLEMMASELSDAYRVRYEAVPSLVGGGQWALRCTVASLPSVNCGPRPGKGGWFSSEGAAKQGVETYKRLRAKHVKATCLRAQRSPMDAIPEVNLPVTEYLGELVRC